MCRLQASRRAEPLTSRRTLLKWSVLALTAGCALAADLVTKHLAQEHLALGETHQLLSFLSLERTANSGVAFGLFGGNTTMIIVANLVALLVVAIYVALERHALLAGIAGGLVVGGSIGNLIQRLSGDGLVTDFLKLPHWPNFNAADVCIDVGIAVIFLALVVEAIRSWRAGRRTPAAR